MSDEVTHPPSDPTLSDPARSSHPRRARSRTEPVLAVVVVLIVALLARLVPTLRGSGLRGINFYDDGVYYAAATGLVHGRLPYRDFLLLHPPGIALALAPFAELARWLGDATGFAVARVCFMVLGGVNAVLVSRFLRPVGVFAAWSGGLFYAVFWPAVYSEHTVLLEGLANTCLLGSLLLVCPPRRGARPSTTALLGAGALLGLATSIKIWGVVAVVVVFGWLLLRGGPRRAGTLLLGAATSTVIVCLPFFVAAPRTMWRMVVLDQLQRNVIVVEPAERLDEIVGLSLWHPLPQFSAALVVALAVVLLALVAGWVHPRTRLPVVLVLALGALLMWTPSWFVHYTALTAAVLAIVIGAGTQQLLRLPGVRRLPAVRVVLGALVLAGLVALAAPVVTVSVGHRFPGRQLEAEVAPRFGCVTSDHPSALILMNVMSRNLDRGCPLVVDLGGASYDLPSPARGLLTRRHNPEFQAYAMRYLRSGDTAIIARFSGGYGLEKSNFSVIQSWPVVGRAPGYRLYAPQTARVDR